MASLEDGEQPGAKSSMVSRLAWELCHYKDGTFNMLVHAQQPREVRRLPDRHPSEALVRAPLFSGLAQERGGEGGLACAAHAVNEHAGGKTMVVPRQQQQFHQLFLHRTITVQLKIEVLVVSESTRQSS